MKPRTDSRPFKQRSQAGFSLVEVLVAIMLMGIIVLVVVTPLTGFFGLTRRSNQQVDATQLAQRTLETIRGEWLNQARYDQVCSSVPLPQPPGGSTITVEVTNLDPNGAVLGTAAYRADCATVTAGDTSPLRRVEVTHRDSQGKVQAKLAVEVARP